MHRPDPPDPSCVSMKSDRSMGRPIHFSGHTGPGFSSFEMHRPDPPDPSCVSMKSDRSMGRPIHFSGHTGPGFSSFKMHRPDPPDPSCVSMKSDRSMDRPIHFSGHTDPGFSLSCRKITDEGCAALTSALRSISHLRELNLSENIIGDKGLKLLSDELKDPHCKLEKLWLRDCEITAKGCAALTSALRSNSHLRELNLSQNEIGDKGLTLLSDGLKDPHCKLEKLWLWRCKITDEGCAALTSALRSNSHLRELDLSGNNLRDASVKSLSALKDNPHYKLKTLQY